MKTFIINAAKAALPVRLRSALFHFAFNVAREEFDEFAYRYAHAPNMRRALIAAKERGFAPKVVLDIGAFEGGWTRMAKSIWPDASIIMVEANEEKRAKLETAASDANARLKFALLGAEDGKMVDFYVMGSGSSVFEEESRFERKKVQKTVLSLDTLLADVDRADFIKIDTQGYELEVLKGASRLLGRAEAVLLEVSLIEINEGAPLLDDVLAFMRAKGFFTYDIAEIHRRQLDQATNQIDLLFVRDGSPLRASQSFT